MAWLAVLGPVCNGPCSAALCRSLPVVNRLSTPFHLMSFSVPHGRPYSVALADRVGLMEKNVHTKGTAKPVNPPCETLKCLLGFCGG